MDIVNRSSSVCEGSGDFTVLKMSSRRTKRQWIFQAWRRRYVISAPNRLPCGMTLIKVENKVMWRALLSLDASLNKYRGRGGGGVLLGRHLWETETQRFLCFAVNWPLKKTLLLISRPPHPQFLGICSPPPPHKQLYTFMTSAMSYSASPSPWPVVAVCFKFQISLKAPLSRSIKLSLWVITAVDYEGLLCAWIVLKNNFSLFPPRLYWES